MKPITGREWLLLALLLSCPLSSLSPASAEILFRADFETGDLSQFGGQSKGAKPGHIEVVTDVVHAGKYAGRFSIHGDDVFNAQQLRVQVNGPKVTVKEGTDTFVSFYLYMKEAPKDRDNFFYWEGSPPPGYNNVMTWWVEPKKDGAGTAVKYGTGNLGRKGVHWEGDFAVGRWHQLGIHIHWSEDAAKGNAKLWWDGEVVLDKRVQTKGPQAAYFCQPGIHRSPHANSVDTIYFDDFICATTLEEIEIQKPTKNKWRRRASTPPVHEAGAECRTPPPNGRAGRLSAGPHGDRVDGGGVDDPLGVEWRAAAVTSPAGFRTAARKTTVESVDRSPNWWQRTGADSVQILSPQL